MKNELSKLIKAIKTYKMIEEGDKIAIGLSGGKDSLLLLSLLAKYQKICGFNFSLEAITIDMGFQGTSFAELQKFTADLGIPYHIEKTNIYDIIFNIRKEKNPCSLCAKLRRGMLCSIASQRACNKLALGHHKDDCIETFFLSMIFEGRLSTFSPTAYMSNTNITVIRPMIFMAEAEVIEKTKDYPIFHNPCPANKNTKREEIKKLLSTIEKSQPGAKENIIKALQNPSRNNLWKD